jgi:hypothetical protein
VALVLSISKVRYSEFFPAESGKQGAVVAILFIGVYIVLWPDGLERV